MNPTTLSFPLYRRPGGVVFLDDDRDYLEMLAEVMPPDWYVRLFLRPVACIEFLQQEPPLWEADAWAQQEIVNRWRQGASLIPQILQYWREDGTARFALTQVCVVDYSMPAMSGLRVLSALTGWSGSRILLTGRADEQLAVSAFNRGLINQFIPKQSAEIRLRLTDAIQSLRQFPHARHQPTWRATLTREQHALLCDPAIAQALEHLTRRQGWIEHVVIGAPFGVLALDQKGGVSWLQLEPAENLPELAEMAASQGWDAPTVQDIRAGKRLLDLELQLALGTRQQAQPRQAFAMAGESARLYAALFAVNETFSPGFMRSHERFIATCGERLLQD
ncbi:MAG: response regulator [Polaromonas sp.]|nr:response regulator [Polaromonas sp.]